MFTGDSSGDWLYGALHRYGFANQPESIAREDGLALSGCYVTAAARCAPPDNKPERRELDRCRRWLEAELELLHRVDVVVVLGRIAWEAWLRASGWWSRLSARDRPLFAHGRETRLADGTILIASFHPSRQNTQTGRLTRRMWERVFRRARALIGPGAVFIPRPLSPARRARGSREGSRKPGAAAKSGERANARARAKAGS